MGGGIDVQRDLLARLRHRWCGSCRSCRRSAEHRRNDRRDGCPFSWKRPFSVQKRGAYRGKAPTWQAPGKRRGIPLFGRGYSPLYKPLEPLKIRSHGPRRRQELGRLSGRPESRSAGASAARPALPEALSRPDRHRRPGPDRVLHRHPGAAAIRRRADRPWPFTRIRPQGLGHYYLAFVAAAAVLGPGLGDALLFRHLAGRAGGGRHPQGGVRQCAGPDARPSSK